METNQAVASRCKFTCQSKTITGAGEQLKNSFTFMPVAGGTEENKKFWQYTPAGKFELTSLNPNVDFVPGQEYYLDITPVAAPASDINQ